MGFATPRVYDYDDAGNKKSTVRSDTSATVLTFTHDAWNRLVEFKNDAIGNRFETYAYNGLNWRTRRTIDPGTSGGIAQDRLMYYSANWQLLEERIDDDHIATPGIDRHVQYVWGPRYIDDIVLHREDGDLDGDYLGANDNYWFHCTDVQFSTVAILDDIAKLAERVSYDAYGFTRHHRAADINGDGAVNTTDSLALNANWGAFGPGDLNRDGTVNVTDLLMLNGDWGAALLWGELSHRTPGVASHPDNTVGWDGYLHSGFVFLYHVRNRCYEMRLGRWVERDPAGYVDGLNFYEYVQSKPLNQTDPYGLCNFKIKCVQIVVGGVAVPGSHCWIDFGDGDVCSANSPVDWPAFGPMISSCVPWEGSRDQAIERAAERHGGIGGPLGPTRTTPIHCPGVDCKAAKKCVQDAFKQIHDCKIPYDPLGPNSNGSLMAIVRKCLESKGCRLIGTDEFGTPRTTPNAPPIGWPPRDDDRQKPIDDCLNDNSCNEKN